MSTIERAIEKLRLGDHAKEEKAAPPVVPFVVETPSADATAPILPAGNGGRAAYEQADSSMDIEDGGSRVTLNFERLSTIGIVTPDAERSQVAEEFRHVKRPLLLNAFGEGALPKPNRNLIMVCSAGPGEGKTYTAINLALSIALERDRTVLLVDADVAKPSVARVLDFPVTAGLVDFLADHDRSLSDLMLKTSLPKLRILPAGRRHAHSTELLASESMQQLAQELSDRYSDRVVVFDSPPLLATSEAAVLAGLMGQVVMVVEAGKTKREELKEALGLLNPDQYIGLVLNKSGRPFGTDYYYGYGSYGG